LKQFTLSICALCAMLLTGLGCSLAQAPAPERPRTDFAFGVLQSTVERAPQMNAASIELAHVGVPWRRFEPRAGQVDAAYVAEVKTRINALRAAGQKILLDVGIQYAPDWISEISHSRYKNQYGEEFIDDSPGMRAPNAVWNQAVRDKIEQHYARVFQELGTDFHQVRLGGGWYGELHFPKSKVGERTNLYWGFDDIAQGRAPGLPAGMKPAPKPGWKPGTPSLLHRDAALFADWYMGSMQNYHDWQIQTVRKMYPGSARDALSVVGHSSGPTGRGHREQPGWQYVGRKERRDRRRPGL
jgi:hypothetical protein